MIIIDFSFRSLDEYRKAGKEARPKRPQKCPGCGNTKCLWKHSAYYRKTTDGDETVDVRIGRFRCRYCHLVLSCIFSFLIPYRRHTTRVIAASVEEYAVTPLQIPQVASYRKIAGNRGCSRMAVFRWTDLLASRAELLHYQIQKEYILRGQDWRTLLQVGERRTLTNAALAHSAKKRNLLESLYLLAAISSLFLSTATDVFERLHTYFLKASEVMQLIFAGREIDCRNQQSLGHLN